MKTGDTRFNPVTRAIVMVFLVATTIVVSGCANSKFKPQMNAEGRISALWVDPITQLPRKCAIDADCADTV